MQRSAEEVQRSLARWAAERSKAQQEVTAASRALSACLAERDADCGAEENALDDARDRLATAEENLAAARRCQGRLQAATGQFRRELAVFRSHLHGELAAGAAFLGGLATAADAYAGSTFGGSSPVGGGSGSGSVPEPREELPRIGGTDLVEVSLDRVDLRDSGVSGPGSYKKVPYSTMREGIQRLDEVVLPAVRGGADSEHFARMDAELGLDYEHGYQRIYDAFFGSDSLYLNVQGDGSYSVTNGYHRIHLAGEMGLRTLPARIAKRHR